MLVALCGIILLYAIIHTIVRYIANGVANRYRKKEEEFFQRQYIDDNFKQQRDDICDLRCKVVDNLYRIENLEEKLNKKETKKNVKKKKRN
jgi:predicted P-loop ATPase/GTPase